MNTSRLEAFSDGVLAIIITIMVLELRAPEGENLSDIRPLIPTLTSYILSFVYVGIYWNNHHHLWHIVEKVNGKILWANLHLLFWLSLLPFTTSWLGKNHLSTYPVAFYGFVLLMASIAWFIMSTLIMKSEGKNSGVVRAFKNNIKSIISMIVYFIATILAFYKPIISIIIYILVAAYWFIPEKRVEELKE